MKLYIYFSVQRTSSFLPYISKLNFYQGKNDKYCIRGCFCFKVELVISNNHNNSLQNTVNNLLNFPPYESK